MWWLFLALEVLNHSLLPKSGRFFSDQSYRVGDIIIVDVDTNETGQWQDNTNLQRNNNGTDLSPLIKKGIKTFLKGSPDLDPVDLRGVRRHQTSAGSRQVVRIVAKIPVVIVRESGQRVRLRGVQEISFGNERRSVEVTGTCMIDDIQNGQIKFSQLAGGRLSIRGRGEFSDIKRLPLVQRGLSRVGMW